jgi:lipopolysaccharide transport system permease protein
VSRSTAHESPPSVGSIALDGHGPAGLGWRVYAPSRGWVRPQLRELWEYRELLYFLALRDVTVRYKQAVLGVAWAVLQPLFTMVVFTLIFGGLARLPSEGAPYAVFTFTALLPWQLFSGTIQKAGTSLVGNAGLLTKVYFPRLIIPAASSGANVLDFGIALVVLFAMMLFYRVPFRWELLLLPVLTALTLFTAFAVSLWLSALNVLYRDVQQTIPFLVQAWMFLSPVAYSASLVPSGRWRLIYAINPMVGIIQAFRWAVLGGSPPGAAAAASLAVVLGIFVSGLYFFRRMERSFADIV